eukprot:TRINITY_DN79594_c0_g1_i1.p1 TRINITY_DN79594_c0_g1~~TRINITY_DN79594_c0_g1_i1.p1  ORF type:complete len:306 (-),score=44.08 TRINITY_DN79594_c0_g1_i1:1-843(-)
MASDQLRASHPSLLGFLPKYKLSLTNKVTITVLSAGTFVLLNQIFSLLMLYMQNQNVCDGLGKFNVSTLILAYTTLMYLMFIRLERSRLPKEEESQFERILRYSLIVFVGLAVSMPFLYHGQIVQVPEDPSVFVCVVTVDYFEINVVTIVVDLLMSSSLLYLFYARVLRCMDPGASVDNRETYLAGAMRNVRCSLVLLSCTLAINLIGALTDTLFQTYGVNSIFYYGVISLLLLVAIVVTMLLIGPSFDWSVSSGQQWFLRITNYNRPTAAAEQAPHIQL